MVGERRKVKDIGQIFFCDEFVYISPKTATQKKSFPKLTTSAPHQ